MAEKKKTSLFTWLVLFGILWFVYLAATKDTPRTSSTASSTSSTPSRAPAPEPSWRHRSSTDEMTGEVSHYATSPDAMPARQMSFPYANMRSWVAFGCKKGSEWAYFGFTTSPNITGDETRRGYNEIDTRIRWDSTVSETTLVQEWGSKFLHFSNTEKSSAAAKLAGANSVRLELNWYGQGKVHFDYTLKGSSAAISKARAGCK
ncbi:MAG: hypothetical protein AAGA44_10125 [Pseudomonadota bacterium]